MRSQQSSPNLHGFLNLHKPAGPTSQQAVTQVRRAVGVKVGHCGTLDPSATGVLPLCLGAATRLSDFVHPFPKAYEVWATFGVATTTLDAQGEVVASEPQPALSSSDVEGILTGFQGQIEQIPPLISAVHLRGRRLYQYARMGQPVQPPSRTVHIFRLRLLSFRSGDFPTARLDVLCSSGTYIRSLCRDLAEALGCPAHVSRLVRTRVGPFRLEHSLSLAMATREASAGNLARHIIPPHRAGLGLPILCLDEDLAYEISHGNEVLLTAPPPPSLISPPNDSLPNWLLVNNPSASLLALCQVEHLQAAASPSQEHDLLAIPLLLKPTRILLGAAGGNSQ